MSTREIGAPGEQPPEVELWFAFKRAHEVVRAKILADVAEAGGLSESDLAILIHLGKAGGSVRQSELAAALGWDRTRISHQLTRMQKRSLLDRDRGTAVIVTLTDSARDLLAAVQPRLADAVHQHFTGHMSPEERAAFHTALQRLST